MKGIQLQNIHLLYLLWLVPLLLLFLIYGMRKRRGVLSLFRGFSAKRGDYVLSAVLISLAAVFLVFTAVRPAWNPEKVNVEGKGRDVVFLVDVSNSMLAEDLKPSRLEGAKLSILDTLKVLRGDRVALVAFAGNASILCPLTLDYNYFSFAVKGMSVNSVTLGGTNLGAALDKVLSDVLRGSANKYRDIILITDGEDHGGAALEEAQKAGKQGVRLIILGIGDDKTGKRIPVTDSKGNTRFLTYRGEEVWTKLDSATLRKMASRTPGGGFVMVGTNNFDLADIYKKYVSSQEGRETFSQSFVKYEEKYQIFLFAAFLLLLVEAVFALTRKRAGRKGKEDE